MAKVEYITEKEYWPQKVVIVAGPTFGQAMKFMLFGAAVGAGTVYYLLQNGSISAAPGNGDAVLEGLTAGSAKADDGEALTRRLNKIASRVKTLTVRARALAQSAGESLKPTLDQVVAEGKEAANEMTAKLKADISKAGDRPAMAEAEEQV